MESRLEDVQNRQNKGDEKFTNVLGTGQIVGEETEEENRHRTETRRSCGGDARHWYPSIRYARHPHEYSAGQTAILGLAGPRDPDGQGSVRWW